VEGAAIAVRPTFGRLADDADGHASGWDPNGTSQFFDIAEWDANHSGSSMSIVSLSLHDNDFSGFAIPVRAVTNVTIGSFRVSCEHAPSQGAIPGYARMNP
jgi:hypothetical protein